MHRILEAFDRFFSTAIVFVYLVAMLLGTGTYFLGHAFGIPGIVTIAIAFGLATAAEVHSFLEQRHTRDYFARLQHLRAGSPEADAMRFQFWLHLGITSGLVLFSMCNGIAFWALEARPASLGDWLAVSVRGVIVPLFFLAAGFLTPLHADPHETINGTAHTMLTTTMRATKKQFKRRVRRIKKSGADLTPLTIALLEDAGDTAGAERLRLIATGLATAEGRSSAGPEIAAFDRPPTGPGTPSASSIPSMRLLPASSAEERRVRDLLTREPAANPSRIAEACNVSLSTASKYWRLHGTPATGATTTSTSAPRQTPRQPRASRKRAS